MIVGIGTDLLAQNRIERVLQRFPERFVERILTLKEQQRYQSLAATRAVRYLSMQFAAKEAVSKALGTGMQQGVRFNTIEIDRDSLGRPRVLLHAGAKVRGDTLGIDQWHISLSDDSGFIMSVAIAESGRSVQA